MKSKSTKWLLGVLLLILGSSAEAQVYHDSTAAIDARVADLLARMTAEEKFWQLFMIAGDFMGDETRYRDGLFGLQVAAETGDVDPVTRANEIQRHFVKDTRLGIPIIFFAEALHGLVQSDATVFPQAIGLAATFDTTLMHEVARAAAIECRSRGVRQVLSPVVNIASDVRWGRTEETYGEDPFLSAAMGVAFVSEFETLGVITTPKHFIANVGDGGRDSYPIHLSERLLREVHLPPFEACIRRGGSRSVMTSYNSVDGSPCSAGDWLNNHLLKRDMDFAGLVISDAGAVGGANVLHFTAADYPEAGARAVAAGLDVIFQTSYDHHPLFIPPFLDGRLDAAVIDSAVGRVLRAKFQLRLFEQPYVDAARFTSPGADKHRQAAYRAALESIVLLKNSPNVLPLSKEINTLAVIGPDAAEARLGGYSAPCTRTVSIVDGLKDKLGQRVDVVYAVGCKRLAAAHVTTPSEYLSCGVGDSLVTGLRGEYFDNVSLAGAPVVVRVDQTVQFQWTLFSPDPERLPNDFYSVRWTGLLTPPVSGDYRIGIEGNDGYRLFIDNVLVIDNWIKASCRTVLVDYAFEAGRSYGIRLEYYDPTGNGRIRLVWNVGADSDEEQSIREACELTARSDAAIMVVGLEEGEFRDRASLSLPGRQEELIRRVAALGKPTAVVLVGGSAVTMSNWLADVSSVLCVWYPGEAGGRAVADVLFGDYNPAGRLPITFPIAEGQLPLVYNHLPTGRGDDYYDLTGQPLFPFGFGLSYTEFEYSDLRLEPPVVVAGQRSVARFTVRNAGPREGYEVVQLYVRDELASVARPITELKGFQRVHLEAGEMRELTFVITPELLTMLDAELRRVIEPGTFRIMIGGSSKDIRLRGILTVTE
jgi:beta-glucosidase